MSTITPGRGDHIALKNSMNAIMEHLGLDPENLPEGSYSEIVIGAMQALSAHSTPFDLDRAIDAIARVAYSYAVHLDEATRGADDDALEGIARTSTSNLKAMIRKILTEELP